MRGVGQEQTVAIRSGWRPFGRDGRPYAYVPHDWNNPLCPKRPLSCLVILPCAWLLLLNSKLQNMLFGIFILC